MANEFVRPPPAEPINNYSLQVYLQTIEQRRWQADAQPVRAVDFLIDADVPLVERFKPRRVNVDDIEAISPIATPRRVRILHGPVRASNLNTGYARFFPGETHTVSARAAHALVTSGCAEYTDAETAEVA